MAQDRSGDESNSDSMVTFHSLRWGVELVLCLCLLGQGSRAWGAEASTNRTAGSASPGAAAALPASADLRPQLDRWGFAPRSQGKRGTCSVFAVTGALEYAATSQGQPAQRFSPEFLNWAANQVVGVAKDGGFFSDLCRGFARYGICADNAMPYEKAFEPALAPGAPVLADAKARLALGVLLHWIKEWDIKTGLTDAQLLEIRRTLSRGWPVCAGMRWPKQAQWSNNILQMCPAQDVFDGHSVLLVGYRDDSGQPGGGVLIFRDSGSGGRDASLPYLYASSYINDALWFAPEQDLASP
jgi:hypothetical protein